MSFRIFPPKDEEMNYCPTPEEYEEWVNSIPGPFGVWFRGMIAAGMVFGICALLGSVVLGGFAGALAFYAVRAAWKKY
jgi:hypothetical protein